MEIRPASDLATALREFTRHSHRALDHHPVLAALTGASVTLAQYVAALAALHGAYRAIEDALLGFAPAELFPGRTPDIAADLSDLGCHPHPLRVQVPVPHTDAARVGMMYVIEGSNLGGVAITRHLLRVLPADVPLRFFGGADGESRWNRFWQLARQRCPASDQDLAVEAARETFGFFLEHIDSCH